MSKCQRIRNILVGGPATREEIRLVTEFSRIKVHIALMALIRCGHVRATQCKVNDWKKRTGPKAIQLYELTPKGIEMVEVSKRKGCWKLRATHEHDTRLH